MKQNLVNGQGETLTLNITFKDPEGTPVDLTGHSVNLVVVTKTNDPVGTYAAVVNDNGGIAVKVEDESTALWPTGKHAYRVEHHNGDGDIKWLLFGNLTVVDGAHV